MDAKLKQIKNDIRRPVKGNNSPIIINVSMDRMPRKAKSPSISESKEFLQNEIMAKTQANKEAYRNYMGIKLGRKKKSET
jgi:hypothetical protein